MNKLQIAALLVAVGCWFGGQAQEIVLEQDVEADTTVSRWGKNRKHFDFAYTAFGLIVGEPDSVGSETNVGSSYEIGFGWRHKTRFGNFYSMGYGLGAVSRVYNIKQDSTKIFPTSDINDRERLTQFALNGQWYNRFNVGKRGNAIGNYLDLGVYGELALSTRHRIRNRQPDDNPQGAEYAKVIYTHLDYMNIVNYGVDARIGIGHLVFFGRYRLSNHFKEKSDRNYPELARYTVGIELGQF